MGLLDTLKRQGGIKLIKEYWHAGVLFYALWQILLTGTSKKSLEIVRYGTYLRINRQLRKQYSSILQEFDHNFTPRDTHSGQPGKVWVCWMQGMENAPDLVHRCFKALNDNIKDREITLITECNFRQYIDLPDWLLEKYRKGIISHTHFSDLLRIELLCRHGGTWIDSTVFCSGNNIPRYMLDSELFMFQNLKPGADGSTLNVSSLFMTSKPGNKILLAVRELLWQYWKENNRLIDYFLLHHFLVIVGDYYASDWKKMVQFPNSFPHVLLLMLFDRFSQEKWDAVTQACPFHKLTYKRSKEEMDKPETYYKYLMTH